MFLKTDITTSMDASESPILTISELNQLAKECLEEALPWVWVEGEISNLAQPASGHVYFSLKDSQAQVRCAFFRQQARKADFGLENGLQIIVLAQVGLYAPRGDYQLIIQEVQPAGIGLLQRAYEKLKGQLKKAGLFAEDKKQALPELPQSVGVVTSPTGAAIRDILSVFKRRFPSLKVVIYPTLVQGDNAAANIAQAIQIANQRKECDCLLVSRGGGSLEDLWPFNEEVVAYAIYESQLPVITGIGHRTDTTIADFVADVAAPTPSAAAEMISPDVDSYLEHINGLVEFMIREMYQQFTKYEQTLKWLAKSLKHPRDKLLENQQRIDELHNKMNLLIRWKADQYQSILGHNYSKLLRHSPEIIIQQQQVTLRSLREKLITTQKHQLSIKQKQLAQISHVLQAVSPLNVLARGYSIVTNQQNKVISQAKKVKKGDNINIKLQQGTLACQVESVKS